MIDNLFANAGLAAPVSITESTSIRVSCELVRATDLIDAMNDDAGLTYAAQRKLAILHIDHSKRLPRVDVILLGANVGCHHSVHPYIMGTTPCDELTKIIIQPDTYIRYFQHVKYTTPRPASGQILSHPFGFGMICQTTLEGSRRGNKMAMPRKEPTPIDKLVGTNIRIHRMNKKMSQEKLGDALGLTFQQVQKYEKGTNRVGAGRLHQIAGILGIPVTALFEGSDVQPDSGGSMLDLLAEPYSLRLIQAMSEITDKELRRTVVELVEQIAVSRGARPGTTKRRTAAGRH